MKRSGGAHSFPARYIFAILILALATILRFTLAEILGTGVPFILFFPAIVLCAWYGGLWPGLLCTFGGGFIAWYAFIPPYYSLRFSDLRAAAQLVVFVVAGMLISFLAERLHQARQKVEENEKKEHEQREWFQVTLASIGDAVIASDPDGRISFMNSVAESLTGWALSDAQGKILSEIFRIVNEETGEEVENPALQAVQERRIVGLANNTVLIRKDGTRIPISDSASPIQDHEGKSLGAVLIFRDIAARRKREQELFESREALRMAMEAAQMGTWTRELDGTDRVM